MVLMRRASCSDTTSQISPATDARSVAARPPTSNNGGRQRGFAPLDSRGSTRFVRAPVIRHFGTDCSTTLIALLIPGLTAQFPLLALAESLHLFRGHAGVTTQDGVFGIIVVL